jgi:hypothetical protein
MCYMFILKAHKLFNGKLYHKIYLSLLNKLKLFNKLSLKQLRISTKIKNNKKDWVTVKMFIAKIANNQPYLLNINSLQ